ncbi:MAG: hypothetical protein KatS3mg130_1362 [Candidatus Sumerlaea sp.]|uniref:Uncharacterized protein n=1 Tax=Sumerlaea chitinivorans TaxID=2250252 RepID=A0A2Z4Y6T0_SUMC1|nr:hypothetical protein BRCON_1426 [Candidatus Sumerlaea chitinivorans]GIX44954.1 MAG: hypothetical protein KatS3mg130_1362 [Candidatus Sumerlaea sp.]
MRKLWATICLLAGLGFLLIGYYTGSTYYGRLYDVMASRGVHSIDVYEARLKRAVGYDPTYGYARAKLAQYYLRHGTSSMALNEQLKAMETFNSVRNFAQLGTIYLRFGKEKEAKETFERAVRMNPNFIEGWERLALLALREGDSERVQELTGEILRRDVKNLNAYYLRAKDSEQRGDLNGALLNYQMISAELYRRKSPLKDAMFTEKDIREKLDLLKKQLESQG